MTMAAEAQAHGRARYVAFATWEILNNATSPSRSTTRCSG